MGATLQGLPAELLLDVISSLTTRTPSDSWDEEKWKSRLDLTLYKALRATCTELDTKILYLFGSGYFKQFNIKLSELHLSYLGELSGSRLEFHVQNLLINFKPLFEQTQMAFEEDPFKVSEIFQHI